MIELKKIVSFNPDTLSRPLFDHVSNPPRDSNSSSVTSGRQFNRYMSISTPSPFKLINLPLKKKPSILEFEPDAASMQDHGKPQEFKEEVLWSKQEQKGTTFVYNNYDIFDLTFSLIDCNLSLAILSSLFFIQVIIRYFSIICLIYLMVATKLSYWEWILALFSTYILYCICIVKISLKFPQTKSECILRQSFNSLQENDYLEFFQVIQARKLGFSILRGITPPELSFLYIKNLRTNVKNFHVYVMINYIYNSIEAFIYYPFYLTYTLLVYYEHLLSTLGWIFPLSYCTILLSEGIFIALSGYLIYYGCSKKGYLHLS